MYKLQTKYLVPCPFYEKKISVSFHLNLDDIFLNACDFIHISNTTFIDVKVMNKEIYQNRI